MNVFFAAEVVLYRTSQIPGQKHTSKHFFTEQVRVAAFE